MVLLESAARTATTNSKDVFAFKTDAGVIVYLNVSANPGGAETLTVAIQGQDPATGNWITLTAYPATAAAANAAYTYELHPGAAETTALANHEASAGVLPRTFRVKVTHSAAGSWTYTVGAHLAP